MTSPDPKRILLISTFFASANPGGGVTFSSDLVREWLRRGNEVHVLRANLARSNFGDFVPYMETGQLHVYGVVSEHDAITSPHARIGGVSATVSALLRRISPRVIHVNNIHGMLDVVEAAVSSPFPVAYTPLDFGLSCFRWYRYDDTLVPCFGPEEAKCAACLRRGLRYEWRDIGFHLKGLAKALFGKAQGLRFHAQYFNPVSRRYVAEAVGNLQFMLGLFSRFRWITAASPPLREEAIRFRGGESGIHLLTYPVKPALAEGSGAEVKASPVARLLFLGHSHEIKGLPFLLEVLELLPDGVPIEVIDGGGNTHLVSECSARVKRYLRSSTRIPSAEVAGAIRAYDAVLVPSLWHENTPLVVLEALSLGRPVIAAQQAGITHLVRHKENGYIFEAGNHQAWAEGLAGIASNLPELHALRQNCHYRKSPQEYVDELEGLGC